MKVTFRTTKLAKTCSNERLLNKYYGLRAKKLQQRLAELSAAEALSDISALPATRLHPHSGKPKGYFSIDVVHPFRIIFTVADNPMPLKPDGGVDLTKVTEVVIEEIYDPH